MIKKMTNTTFNTARINLYSFYELYDNYKIGQPESINKCTDRLIYKYLESNDINNKDFDVVRSFSEHDDHLNYLLNKILYENKEKKHIGFVGGHNIARDEDIYTQCARLSRKIAQNNCLVITGGGPGIMEAAQLGACFRDFDENEMSSAIDDLSKSPNLHDEFWFDQSYKLFSSMDLSEDIKSVSVHSWHFPDEPTSAFSNCIAKFFNDNTREFALLSSASDGLVVMPGSIGTLQELFIKLVLQQYNNTSEFPIVLYGEDYWTNKLPLLKLLDNLKHMDEIKNIRIIITEDLSEILSCFSKR